MREKTERSVIALTSFDVWRSYELCAHCRYSLNLSPSIDCVNTDYATVTALPWVQQSCLRWATRA